MGQSYSPVGLPLWAGFDIRHHHRIAEKGGSSTTRVIGIDTDAIDARKEAFGQTMICGHVQLIASHQ